MTKQTLLAKAEKEAYNDGAITDLTLKKLVDSGGALDVLIKEETGALKEIKGLLREEARIRENHLLSGGEFEAKISPSTRSQTNPKQVYDLFKSRKMSLQDFFDVVTVSVTALEKKIGESGAEGVVEKKTDAFGKVAFKPKKE